MQHIPDKGGYPLQRRPHLGTLTRKNQRAAEAVHERDLDAAGLQWE